MTFHNPIHEGAPLELKSEADDLEGQGAELPEALTAVLDGIRTDLVARLEKLETKSAAVEKRLARPAIVSGSVETKAEPAEIERKAFNSYLRRGAERMQPDEVKSLTVSTDTAGGFLAPPEFGSEILKRLVEFSPLRSYARTVQISAPEIRYPRRVNSVGASWVSETGERTGSEPSFSQMPIAPSELATFVDVSNALLEDNAYDLEGELAIEFAEAFGVTEGAAFVSGTGIGQPKGLFTAAGIAELKTGAAAGFPAANPVNVIIAMFHALPTAHAQRGAWIMNRKTMGTIRQWMDAMGRPLLIDPVKDSAPTTLLGRPIVECVDAPDIAANAYPIMFGDLQGYRIVDRVNLQTLRDPFTLAAKGQVRIHARKRVGGDLTHPDRFVKLKIAA